MINPGKLNTPCSILIREGTTASGGPASQQWRVWAKLVWAEFKTGSRDYQSEANVEREKTTATITIRYLPGVKAGMRIREQSPDVLPDWVIESAAHQDRKLIEIRATRADQAVTAVAG